MQRVTRFDHTTLPVVRLAEHHASSDAGGIACNACTELHHHLVALAYHLVPWAADGLISAFPGQYPKGITLPFSTQFVNFAKRQTHDLRFRHANMRML